MKSEVTEAAKKKRDKSQAQHINPAGGAAYKYGPHKVDVNRRTTDELLPFVPKSVREKIIKFANKFDAKQDKKREAKQTKKKMQSRAKKLTAYESYT